MVKGNRTDAILQEITYVNVAVLKWKFNLPNIAILVTSKMSVLLVCPIAGGTKASSTIACGSGLEDESPED